MAASIGPILNQAHFFVVMGYDPTTEFGVQALPLSCKLPEFVQEQISLARLSEFNPWVAHWALLWSVGCKTNGAAKLVSCSVSFFPSSERHLGLELPTILPSFSPGFSVELAHGPLCCLRYGFCRVLTAHTEPHRPSTDCLPNRSRACHIPWCPWR
jgi:hypothetical protein